jgi:hypothetical protein
VRHSFGHETMTRTPLQIKRHRIEVFNDVVRIVQEARAIDPLRVLNDLIQPKTQQSQNQRKADRGPVDVKT